MPRPLRALLATVLLLSVAQHAAARSLQGGALEGLKGQCRDEVLDDDLALSGALWLMECYDCVDSVENSLEVKNQAWACFGVCQNMSVWPSEAVGSRALDLCTQCVSTHPVANCQSCFERVPSAYTALAGPGSAPGEEPSAEQVTAARSWCTDVCAADPPGYQTQGQLAQYLYACSTCANLPPSEEREWCLQCISTTFAVSRPDGIASLEEVDGPNWPRLNDFGACAARANRTYWTRYGYAQSGGIFEQCAQAEFPAPRFQFLEPMLDEFECTECMVQALSDSQPENSSKAYACAATCRNPNYLPAGVAAAGVDFGELALLCTGCVQSVDVYDAWGCSNCMKRFADASFGISSFFEVEECLDCVVTNPYQGKLPTFDWACGECAAVEDEVMRDVCNMCIRAPATDASASLADNLLDEEWLAETSAVLCSCVDMVKESQWAYGGADLDQWYVQDCPNCTALQRTCYRRRNVTLSNRVAADAPTFQILAPEDPLPEGYRPLDCSEVTAEVASELDALFVAGEWTVCGLQNGTYDETSGSATCSEDAPAFYTNLLSCRVVTNLPGWFVIHIDESVGFDVGGSFGLACASCISEFSSVGFDSANTAACEQYCMNTYTMFSTEQVNDCFGCLLAKAATPVAGNNVVGCEMCIQATYKPFRADEADVDDITARRQECFECLVRETDYRDNTDWACAECSKFGGEDRGICFDCLRLNAVEPSDCVDGTRARWLRFFGSYMCLNATQVNALLDSGDLVGGLAAGSVQSRTECAVIAAKNGAEVFGLLDSTMCYYFQGDLKYMYELGIGAGQCGGECPLDEFLISSNVVDGGCGGYKSIEIYAVGYTKETSPYATCDRTSEGLGAEAPCLVGPGSVLGEIE